MKHHLKCRQGLKPSRSLEEWRDRRRPTDLLRATCRCGIVGFLVLLGLAGGGCAAVEHSGGRIIPTPNVDENRSLLSPPIIVEPLLNCGTAVKVRGFVPDAEIEIFADGTVIGGGIGGDPDGHNFPVSPDLVTGQIITATQRLGGIVSGPSDPVQVQDHTDVYPSGLPKPGFPFLYLYDCGIATYVNNLPPGGTVRISAREPVAGATPVVIATRNGVEAGQTIGIGPPFRAGDEITAESQICTEVSQVSDIQIVQPAPSTLPAPVIHDAWDEGQWISISELVNGTRVTITNGGVVVGGGGAPAGHTRFRVNPPVVVGDVLEVVQELCGVTSTPGTTTVQPCSSLPPALMLPPSAGDTQIQFIDYVPGSRIRIYASGEEIGDGGGSVIQLTRPLADGEAVVAIQSLGSCIASTSHTLDVGTGLEDPADRGLCDSILSFEYGHSGDPDRTTTNVSSYFNSPDSAVSTPMSAVPLHGTVRYPDGPGPYPLVLIVHGNHNPLEASDPGYTYLLDHLASHCMIAVSIDENFLNGSVSGEMDARAIVLLRHLAMWREWNRTPGHRFFTKVDMSRIGLAGHSRGGEAIIVAKRFNSTLHDPTDPDHDFNFAIRSLFAIAPVDGQVEGSDVTVTGADYYVMHGSHDGDVSTFPGHRAYDRTHPVSRPAGDFKGLLYIYGANHAQWNDVWATSGDPFAITGTVPLISEADQKDIGLIYMTTFFNSGLKGWHVYNQLFSGEATFSSLPSGPTRVFQYQDPQRLFLNHYEEDDDPQTGSVTGVENEPAGSATPPLAPYDDIPFSDNGSPHFLWGETDGLVLGWNNRRGSELIGRIDSSIRTDIADHPYLSFRVGQTHETSPNLNTPGVDMEFRVQLRFGMTIGPAVLVSDYAELPYPQVTDAPWWGGGPKTVMQTIRIPWEDLTEGLDSPDSILQSALTEIRFQFNERASGLIVIDEIQSTH